jgi:hypothetical protein
MVHTQRDLALAERSVSALEHFIAEQRRILAAAPWSTEEKAQGRRLLQQFEQTLRDARTRYRELWLELHPEADPRSTATPLPELHAGVDSRDVA